MKRFKSFLLLPFILTILAQSSGSAQELRCNVQILSNQIQGTNKQIYKTLQQDIYEFMNNRIWTNQKFENNERIECKILINLDKHTGDEFSGSMTVSSRRPVYNSSYNTTMFQYKDNDIQFRYLENQPLEFDINSFKSNLTSILAYYAYIIIGLDFDSFSPMGGTPYYNKAQQIVSNAQNARGKGWKAFESRRNRYWLVENILNNEYGPVREFLYQYHRKGLDQMHDDQAQARPAAFARAVGVHAIEALENTVEVILVDPLAGVHDFDAYLVEAPLQPAAHRTAARIRDAVFYQIREHLPDARTIGPNKELGDVRLQVKAFLLSLRAQHLRDLTHQVAQVEHRPVDQVFAVFEAGDVD